MTAEEKALEQEIREQLIARSRIVKDTQAEIRSLLNRALDHVLLLLADQPSDYQLWALPKLAAEITRIGDDFSATGSAKLSAAASQAWTAGENLVIEPLAKISGATDAIRLAAIAPRIDRRQLQGMQHFITGRIKDIGLRAVNDINTQVGLVVIGAQAPHDAAVAVKRILKEASMTRAMGIVQDNLLTVYSTASFEAGDAAEAAGIELEKLWRRSSKAHPRLSHALADGQRVAWNQPFIVGGEKMMHPHDPKASLKNKINCGCVMVPKPVGWGSTVPDKKPFTRDELARNPTLKTVVEGREVLAENASKAAGVMAAGVASGRHAGWAKTQRELGEGQLRKALRSFDKLVLQHEEWIADPSKKVDDWADRSPEYQAGLVEKWKRDAARAKEKHAIVSAVLREKGYDKKD